MIYTVYYRTQDVNRAPSIISLSQYEEVGEVEAYSNAEITAKIAQPDEQSEYVILRPRKVAVGDVVIDQEGNGFIFTPSGIWAQVYITE